MSDSKRSIEDLLSRQNEPSPLRVTIREVSDDETKVTVTPIVVGAGICQCDYSLDISKDQIAAVEFTEEYVECCGARLMVVGIEFTNDTLTDVVSQLAQRSHERVTRIANERGFTPAGWSVPRAVASSNVWGAVDRHGLPVHVDPETDTGFPGTGMPSITGHHVCCATELVRCAKACDVVYEMDGDAYFRYSCCMFACDEEHTQCRHPSYRKRECPYVWPTWRIP